MIFMKRASIVIILFIILINILYVQAINLEVTSKPISNTVLIDLNEPAVFDLTIKNLGEGDTFEIYSLVGIDITPKEPIRIESEETKIIRIKLTPEESLRVKRDIPFTFEYKISDSKNGIQKETLSINILDLGSVFLIAPEIINPNTEKILITIKNKAALDFSSVNLKLTSIFFDHEESFSLSPNEKKEIFASINKDKLKTIDAGTYLMNSKITVREKTASVQSEIKFLEQEGIDISKFEEGFIIKKIDIIGKNIGNTKKIITIDYEKNLISYLFTTTNIPPSSTKISGFKKVYFWEKELAPNEELNVELKTNWFYPIILLIIIIAGIILIKRSIYPDLELRKRVSFVKTKGGEFALKITLKLKAKNHVERINIIDKLPSIVELYRKFGLIHPDKIDLDNKRIEWNIESLNNGESRIFTYIIYSKIGVVGRFELPEARASYEKDGQIKEVYSNRSYYINEPNRY